MLKCLLLFSIIIHILKWCPTLTTLKCEEIQCLAVLLYIVMIVKVWGRLSKKSHLLCLRSVYIKNRYVASSWEENILTNMDKTHDHYCGIELLTLIGCNININHSRKKLDWNRVCPLNEMQRWVELITHCDTTTDRYIRPENAHSVLFINNSDRTLKLMSHFMFFPPTVLSMLLFSEQLAQM